MHPWVGRCEPNHFTLKNFTSRSIFIFFELTRSCFLAGQIEAFFDKLLRITDFDFSGSTQNLSIKLNSELTIF